MGYKCVIFMPDTQSQEKIDALRVLGADVRPVPAVPYDNPDNYNHKAKRFASSISNAVWTNQFDNTANRKAHYETTGPEIWRQSGLYPCVFASVTHWMYCSLHVLVCMCVCVLYILLLFADGKVDAVTFGTGTGGTLAGVGQFMKEKNSNIQVVLADPQGSVLYNYFNSGKLERTEGSSITEGIGQGRVTNNMSGAPIDSAVLITDEEAVRMTFRILHEEGFFVGASSGLNVAAAVKVAKALGPGKTIISCLCDSGQRYFSKLFSKRVLEDRGMVYFTVSCIRFCQISLLLRYFSDIARGLP
jgi:cysteine synthase A